MFGTNDRAFADAELVVNAEELQRVLMALRLRYALDVEIGAAKLPAK
jgi:hypothetical protein